MINRNYGHYEDLKTKNIIEDWRLWLASSRDYSFDVADNYSFTISKIAQDLDVSLINADSIDLREVLCRYYETLSPQTINNYRSIMICFYNYLRHEGIRTDNPAKKIPTRKCGQKLPKWLGKESIDKIISCDFNRENLDDFERFVIIKLMLYCGLSCKTISFISYDNMDINQENDTITFHKGKRVIIYPMELVRSTDLFEYMDIAPYRDGCLFCHYNTPSKIKQMVRNTLVSYCDLYGISSQTLRTTFAIKMMESGVRDIFIAHLLGNRTLNAAYLQLKNNISFLKEKYQAHFCRK